MRLLLGEGSPDAVLLVAYPRVLRWVVEGSMTSSRSKIKGTGFEREVMKTLGWPQLRRTAASCAWDLEIMGESPVEVLVTRPDRGQPLVMMRLNDWAALWERQENGIGPVRIECKRFAKMAWHTIYDETYGGVKINE